MDAVKLLNVEKPRSMSEIDIDIWKNVRFTVEIDDENWHGLDVTPKDVVRIKGEVDKEMFSTEIDVDTIELKK